MASMALAEAGRPAHPENVPPPTVREAMAFGGFAEAELIAGRNGLDRVIEWVRVMETPETARRLRQNELLLTTGFPIKDDPVAQADLVETVVASGGSGLVVKLGRYLTDLPEQMAQEADRVSLPLFTIGQDPRLNHRFAMTSGVLETECAERLKRFFAALRAQGKK